MILRKYFYITVFILYTCLANNVFAGKLGDFEEEASSESSQNSKRVLRQSDTDNTEGSFLGDIFGALFNVAFVFEGMLVGGGSSSYKAESSFSPEEHPTLKPRTNGQRLIPFFRLDALFGDLESDIQLMDYMAETG
jgi:hypothetical protein